MSILKTFSPISIWLMRLAIIGLLIFSNLSIVAGFQLAKASFYLAILKLFLAVILLFGGLLGKSLWTKTSALLIGLLVILDLYLSFSGFDKNVIINILILANVLFFMSNGNKS